MLLVRNLHLRPQHLTLSSTCFAYYRESPIHIARRRYVIQSLCNGFLDLAIALPIPPSLPAYSTTIIVLSVATRFALLPISIWAKQRSQRLEELVLPELEKQKPIAATQVFEAMKVAKVRGDKKDLKAFHAKKTVEMLHEYRKKLYKKYKCQPWPSIIIPPLAQLPVFVTFTVVMQRLSLDPTPFDSESFLTLMTLAHPDPTGTLPIILGIVTLANVESSQWVMNATEREQAMKAEQLREQKIAKSGQRHLNPGKLIKTSLRGLSVFRIMIAMIAPGSVTLYWVTSAMLGLLQTWIMDWLHLRRKRRRTTMAGTSSGNGSSTRTASMQRHQ